MAYPANGAREKALMDKKKTWCEEIARMVLLSGGDEAVKK